MADNRIAVGHGTSPFVSVYTWSGSGFGTKYSDPSTLPTGAGQSVNFAEETSVPSGAAEYYYRLLQTVLVG